MRRAPARCRGPANPGGKGAAPGRQAGPRTPRPPPPSRGVAGLGQGQGPPRLPPWGQAGGEIPPRRPFPAAQTRRQCVPGSGEQRKGWRRRDRPSPPLGASAAWRAAERWRATSCAATAAPRGRGRRRSPSRASSWPNHSGATAVSRTAAGCCASRHAQETGIQAMPPIVPCLGKSRGEMELRARTRRFYVVTARNRSLDLQKGPGAGERSWNDGTLLAGSSLCALRTLSDPSIQYQALTTCFRGPAGPPFSRFPSLLVPDGTFPVVVE